MQGRKLGRTGLDVTVLGLGTSALGGPGWIGSWGPQSDAESIATIRHALDRGIGWIDTAPAYGNGHAEKLVGRALREVSDRPLLFTKTLPVWNENGVIVSDLQPRTIRSAIEGSLERLGVEAVDLYQIHWPVPDEELETAWETLVCLREEGKTRHVGVSNCSVDQLRRLERIHPVETLQPPLSLVERSARQTIDDCARAGIGVIVYSPQASGLLTGTMTRERIAALAPDDWRRGSPEFGEPRLSRNLRISETLACIASRHGTTVGAAAVAWVLAQPGVTAAIVGARSKGQLDQTLPAAAMELSREELAELDRVASEKERESSER